MIIAFLYYLIMKIIGITTKWIFKTDVTGKIREKFRKDLIEYMTTPIYK